MKEYKTLIGGKETTFRFNNFAEQANGSFFVCSGDTVVLSTVTMSKNKREGMDFFPLVVDYEEKFYAAGKIGGSKYTRREAKPTDAAITNSRLIDRAIRPVFPDGLEGVDVQVISSCLSWDKEGDAAIMALLATSISLMVSDIPFNGPVGAVRIIKKDGQFVVNPNYGERELAQIDVVYSGVKDKSGNILINMIEGGFREASNDDVAESFRIAQKVIKELCEFQESIIQEIGKEKVVFELDSIPEEFRSEIESSIVLSEDLDEVKNNVIAFCDEKYLEDPIKKKQAISILEETISEKIKNDILLHHKRMDGRGINDLRELNAEVGFLPRTHGSAIFSRGATRVFSILTLGAPGDSLISEEMGIETKKKFIHHYNFPPYSVGEVRSLKGPSRRDIGHGALAEKALIPVIPESFPYTIRVVSEVVSSNGSTSMASVCGTSLALMDAGVPITKPVAGISIGIIEDGDKYQLLTDIQGLEDHYGGMDLKIAGTIDGITAIQMDVKIRGINEEMFTKSLIQAYDARIQILEKMKSVIDGPRAELSKYAPRVLAFQINPDKIREVIGPGGKMINQIIDVTGAKIDIEDSGSVSVTAEDEASLKKAVEWIKNIIREVEVGEVFQGEVKRIVDFGAFVEILPGQEGLVHISKISNSRVEKVSDVLKLGDLVSVKVIGIDDQGRINLSIKDA